MILVNLLTLRVHLWECAWSCAGLGGAIAKNRTTLNLENDLYGVVNVIKILG
ncbi:hypothetical protein G7B40_005200 [Aetokthonos hydrillicola Thurmond2011]|uniref:Uncharacterized protein n=1 Tax=Aetokthonos hydrillicola Thurmond2011 TaxID=2712845 RepID=A0AAP5I7N0_9CYAN|nr:hypothetical protein [Aetokthonos hydrillicola]MBO3464451.1 hypothetical protein [Aetokthonos hydrillicola CCALA 1050]MBW4586703.1 hypothetical protein [Aetokthonos hydrillicola CCALA 1050]MDR9893970.1 hypothetical protein [Aetokthonos hydrillicola Thurmond2011]